ncbi:MAG: DUF368 domain-containing protein [Acidimicrobiales bacterium]|nr:DUF368 domain-containing protein [Acidimicrobiales bacterium]
MTSLRKTLGLVVRGAVMGAADLVPGVSGGTVALLTGIYNRLIVNIDNAAGVIRHLIRGDLRGTVRQFTRIDWEFFIPLLIGLLTAVLLLASVIEDALVEYPEPMAGLFLGLVGASAIVVQQDVTWTTGRVAIAGVIGIALFLALGWQGPPVDEPSAAALFVSGAIAICAMVLPGISGSFLLLMLGMYTTMIDIVDGRMIAEAAIFGAGALVGLLCFSTLLARLLSGYPNEMLAGMVGLLLGSVRVLWPWPNGVGVTSRHAGESVEGTSIGWPDTAGGLVVPTLLALSMVVAVLGVERRIRQRPAGPRDAD